MWCGALTFLTVISGLGADAPVANTRTIIHVDDDASAGGDGRTWVTAFRYLQDAMAAGIDGQEIRVAGGVYKPDRDAAHPAGTGDRRATFQLTDGVSLKGGYAGFANPQNPDHRDVESYETVLSGDLAGDDRPGFVNYGENSYHVTTVRGTGDTTVLDGFTITAGNANGVVPESLHFGGGLYKTSGAVEVLYCRFSENSGERGGGLYNEDGRLTLDHCTFEANSAVMGGGMVNFRGRLSLGHCTFRDNSGVWGAGLMSDHSPQTTMHHCAFSGNIATGFALGGGLRVFSTNLVAINCVFVGNLAVGDLADGGGLYDNAGTRTRSTLINCVFTGNSTDGKGGGAYFSIPNSSTLINCTFINNSALWGGGGLYKVGRRCNDADATLVNCILWDNWPDQLAGENDPAIVATYCNIQGGWGGAGNLDVGPRFVDAPNGDLHLSADSPCVDAGDATVSPPDSADLDHDGDAEEPLLIDFDGNPRRIDIFGVSDTGMGKKPFVDMGAFEYVLDCNSNGVPDLVDIAGATSQDCNETGVPDECEVDCNGNGVPDACDVVNGTSQDCNRNGVPDECEAPFDCNGNGFCDHDDIANGTSYDCNKDGIPDECGEDCNENGLDDSCDVIQGTSEDCNSDGLPDECLSSEVDCNNNGLIDECETADRISPDENTNGLPDECEPLLLFVDADATGWSNGTSWTSAFKDLHRALTVAGGSHGYVKEIWVAAGTYRPAGPRGSLSATFQLVSGVAVYGGFTGNETSLDQRDVIANETILSGDLGRDDVGDMVDPSRDNNCYHVVTGSETNETAMLDGFTITGGYASSNSTSRLDLWGGGMLNYLGSPTVANCTFTQNSARGGGGAVYNWSSSPRLTNCVFSGNVVQGNGGGAMFNYDNSNPMLIDCRFADNTATCLYQSRGGAIYNYEGCSPTLIRCTFDGNSSSGPGGAIYNDFDNSPIITDCVFSHNHAGHSGGGIYSYNCTQMVETCSFQDNSARFVGGAISLIRSSAIVTNCLFTRNSTLEEEGGALFVAGDTSELIDLTNCTFSGNIAVTDGGGVYNSGGYVALNNCILWNDEPNEIGARYNGRTIVAYSSIQDGWLGAGNLNADPLYVDPGNGNLRLSPGSPCIDAGDNTVVTIPGDLDGFLRFVNDPRTPDTGNGMPPIVDMGAYEFRPGDCAHDGDVDHHDLAEFDTCLCGPVDEPPPGCECFDLDGDGRVDLGDFATFQIGFTG